MPAKTSRNDGLTESLRARCDADLRARAERLWTANKQSESEWVRAACFAYLRHLEHHTAERFAEDPLPSATVIPPVRPARPVKYRPN